MSDMLELEFHCGGPLTRDSNAVLQDIVTVSAEIQLRLGLNMRQLKNRVSAVCRLALLGLRARTKGFRVCMPNPDDGTPSINVRLYGPAGHIDDIERERYQFLEFTIAASGDIRVIVSRVARRISDSLAEHGWVEPSQGAHVTKHEAHARWWAMAALDGLTINEIARREQETDSEIDENAIASALHRMGITTKWSAKIDPSLMSS